MYTQRVGSSVPKKCGRIHVDDMSVDILCTDLRDFRANIVGAVSKNVFCKNRPHGSAIEEGLVRNEVVVWQPRSVCAKFGMDRGNDDRDMSRAKV